MRRLLLLATIFVGMLVVSTLLGEIATGAASARIVDRTFRCTPLALGDGLRDLRLNAVPRGTSVPHLDQKPSPGYIGVRTGGWDLGSELVAVRARSWQRFRTTRSPHGVYAHRGRCRPERVSLALAPRGLPGPSAQWLKEESCPIRGRILLRVRAVLESPAPWQGADQSYIGARRNVVEATLAVRSERTRRPIALMRLDSRGKTKFWASPDCG
jgi:hypothetical protein